MDNNNVPQLDIPKDKIMYVIDYNNTIVKVRYIDSKIVAVFDGLIHYFIREIDLSTRSLFDSDLKDNLFDSYGKALITLKLRK